MIRNILVTLLLSLIINAYAMTQTSNVSIRHTVVFKLKHPEGSAEEKDFIKALMKLDEIPGVENFELLEQISSKNDYDYGLSMEFADQKAYDLYSNHPDHIAFVQTRWLREVDIFLEIDFALPR